ncbi:MAG TPA: glycosyltransferase family 39 protein [Candidatus Acidoferrales bacterium]|nr:glycosyltransferase family 39 protein [Candidatus Acidoferrales bacterium]
MINQDRQLGNDDRKWLGWSYAVLGGLLLYRLAYLASGLTELSQDEALFWLQSKHLALSYYSKPPLTACTQYLGTAIWGDNAFGVRFFAPVFSAIIGVFCLRFCAREISARFGFVVLLISNAIPLLIVGSNLMTIDPLSVMFWVAATVVGWRAVQPDGAPRHWFWVGLWMGFGFLSKYTALFQWLCWAVFFWLWRPARIHLRRPGPYLALLVNVLLATPVLIWNAQNHWVTVFHVGGRADFGRTLDFTLRYFFEFLGSEIVLLNPVFFVGMVWAGIAMWRQRPRDPLMVYFFSMGAPLVFAYLLQSFHARVLGNWIAPAVLPFLLVMVLYWDPYRQRPWVRRNYYTGLILGLAAMIVLTDTDIIGRVSGYYLPMSIDPLRRLRGWQSTAAVAETARQNLLKEGKPAFILCPDYASTSEVTFYLPQARAGVPGSPIVYCWDAEQPITEFHFWPEYQFWRRTGDNAIYVNLIQLVAGTSRPVTVSEAPPEDLLRRFRTVKYLGLFHGDFRGRPVRYFQLFECLDQLPPATAKPAEGGAATSNTRTAFSRS